MEGTSTEVMRCTDMSRENDGSASAAAAAAATGDGSVAKVKSENLGTELPSNTLQSSSGINQ
jgi:hypothetical protein